MRPCDFDKPKSRWSPNCLLCGGTYTLTEGSIPRVCCIKIGTERQNNGVMIVPDAIRNIVLERTHGGSREKLILVDFHEYVPTYYMLAYMCDKSTVIDEIYVGARAYWRKWCHREYQRVIAQVLQRELDLPGEIAAVISEFT